VARVVGYRDLSDSSPPIAAGRIPIVVGIRLGLHGMGLQEVNMSRPHYLASAADEIRARGETVDWSNCDWRVARIEQGIAAAREGRVRAAEEIFTAIAAKHGWSH
jgi:predicted transcriptional regulator